VRRRISVIDSNVLYSVELTDLFLTFATHRLIQLHWSEVILEEVRRSLLRTGRLSPPLINYRLTAMERALPNALASVTEDEVRSMQISENDRHVLALAVVSAADSIITFNVRDFPRDYCENLGIAILTPDETAAELASHDLVGATNAVHEIAHRRRNPTISVDELLVRWETQLPSFVAAMRG